MTWPNDDIDITSLETDTARPDRGVFLTIARHIKEIIAARGEESGIAPLDDDGKLPSAHLDIASPAEARAGRSDEKLITPATLAEAVPAGTIAMWPTETPPSGWRECDGSAISRRDFPRLFAAIGTRYGEGDGRTTFNVPDGRGEFIRGWDHGRGADPDARTRTDRGDGTTGDHVGTRQGDDLRSHRHGYSAGRNYGGSSDSGGRRPLEPGGTAQTEAAGGSETRGRNIALMIIIKT